MKEIIKCKENEVAQVAEKMKNSAALIVFKYQGLTVKSFQKLRK